MDKVWGEDFVEQDEVVGWTGGAHERVVGLEEEVPVAGFGDALVDDPRGDAVISNVETDGSVHYV